MTQAIHHYALIGDLRCAALVARHGSIDWFCTPRFDSPACFAALVGEPKHGQWKLAPVHDVIETRRRYLPDTLVLETELVTADGRVRITDLMPLGGDIGILRLVDGLAGRVDMGSICQPAFHFGSCPPRLKRSHDGVIASTDDQQVLLRSDCDIAMQGTAMSSHFRIEAGERRQFFLSNLEPDHAPDPMPAADSALDDCVTWWREWVSRCTYQGRWRDAVIRSLITLKALTHEPTGGIVAAATSSLPESPGGTANWDYRFCWIRDTVLALDVFLDSNYVTEAQAWRDWLSQLMTRTRGEIRVLYDVAGQDTPPELILDWLPGYRESTPVRASNAASEQHQLDVFGQLMDLLHSARRSGLETSPDMWARQCELIDWVIDNWQKPDEGIWELRGKPRRYTHSRVYAWVALDRSIRDAEAFGLPAPLKEWRGALANIHDDVCTQGIDAQRGAFKQSYEESVPDASLVMIPLLGFLPVDDDRVQATLKWVRDELCDGPLVYRFPARQAHDGPEGAFVACSFWLIDTLLMEQRPAEAQAHFEHILQLRNDVGLLAEQFHPQHGMLGNFPQALSHLALIKTAYFMDACEQAHRGGRPERFGYKPML